MQIKVIVFGQLADIAGKGEMVLNEITDTDQLTSYMHAHYPRLAELPCRIAVDKNIITKNTPLQDQVTVAILPPYSGG